MLVRDEMILLGDGTYEAGEPWMWGAVTGLLASAGLYGWHRVGEVLGWAEPTAAAAVLLALAAFWAGSLAWHLYWYSRCPQTVAIRPVGWKMLAVVAALCAIPFDGALTQTIAAFSIFAASYAAGRLLTALLRRAAWR